MNRRSFLALPALAPLFLPPRLLAATTQTERKFLFILADGGWDPTYVFAPVFGSDDVDIEEDAVETTVNGITFVDQENRPVTRGFFESWGDRCCLLNGFEVRSVTHERCKRLVLTGKSQADADDWPSRVVRTGEGYALPHLVISGPAYTATYTTSVMRIGENGQLGALADGSALEIADEAVAAFSVGADATEAYVRARVEAHNRRASRGRAAVFATDLARSYEQVDLVGQLIGEIDLASGSNGAEGLVSVATRAEPALVCMERGYSRCAIVAHGGQYDAGWDTHSDNEDQSDHFETLFQDLDEIVQSASAKTGAGGGSLLDELCIVVLSEMGRTPKLNSTNGKDHWTFTSALFIGAGIGGGRVLGGYDSRLVGRPIDLGTGAPDDTAGVSMGAEHLGSTILAIAGVDLEADDPPAVEAVIG